MLHSSYKPSVGAQYGHVEWGWVSLGLLACLLVAGWLAHALREDC